MSESVSSPARETESIPSLLRLGERARGGGRRAGRVKGVRAVTNKFLRYALELGTLALLAFAALRLGGAGGMF